MFGSIDTEAEQTLAQAAAVTAIPTLMVFRDGIMVFRQSGALPAPALEELITAVKGLDMDDVRAQVAAADQLDQHGARVRPRRQRDLCLPPPKGNQG